MFATPDEAEHAFYEALEQADLAQLMEVWSDDEEIVCIHPGGPRLVGLQAVQESWQEIFANGPLPIRPLHLHTVQSMMSSVHTVVEQLVAGSGRSRQILNCHATNVYHKGPTGWRLVLHHASQAPAGFEPVPEDIPDLLH
ncbi:YybH family protein [Pigmentiphaga soli]|uniref:YybH family protein n=1 Tax=Pigmentiphaga soli TaxID=1007095 RepID=UPI0031F189B6